MKKIKFIAMAMLALLTAQCKKNEPKPEEKVMVPISGSVSFGGGSKTEITTDGYVTPKNGDKIYIYNNKGTCVGSLECAVPSTKGQEFTCSGTIDENYLGETCTFMYLGSNNGTDGNSGSINFANQTGISVSSGKISGIDKFHVGSCKANVSEGGKVELPMRTKISIAYFKLKDENGNAIAAGREVTISGVSATATINKTDGTLTGVPGDITVQTDANGCFYMALIPKSGEVIFTFSVEGYENATNEFPYGIRECSFYSLQGSGNPLPVTVQKPAYLPKNFSVAADRKVKFSRGNLYYDNGWHFEKNQYDFRTLNTKARCIDGVYGASSGTDVGRGIFGWSTDGTGCNWGMYSSTEIDGDFVEWGSNTIDGVTGYRTLSRGDDPIGEWDYLMTGRTGTYNGAAASAADLFGYATITVSGGSVKGLVLLPDTFVLPEGASFVSSSTSTTGFTANQYTTEQWSKMEEAGAVFLPHTGYYNKDFGGSYQEGQTRYWSSTKDDYINSYNTNYRYAKNLLFQADSSYPYPTSISLGLARVCNFYAVRLVVDVED